MSLINNNNIKPLFCVPKIKINSLYTIYDYQLRSHLQETNDIKKYTCKCTHTHNGVKCQMTTLDFCKKCQLPTIKLVSYKLFYFHKKIDTLRLFKCTNCTHKHKPPCMVCMPCQTNNKCIIEKTYDCDYTTDSVCRNCNYFTKPVLGSELIKEHKYNIKDPLFWFCEQHSHLHNHKHLNNVVCKIQTFQCCESAVFVTSYKQSFFISSTGYKSNNNNSNIKFTTTSYICFDPQIWKDQSLNHFVSFVRAIINSPDAIEDRYQRFESSSFTITNIKDYKSGKHSVIRQDLTGFPTKGIYQTATLSGQLPAHIVLIPQELYNLAQKLGYDLSLVLVKRDPSFHLMCMYVCEGIKNPDPTIATIIISSELSKPLNQDQDGDKNGIYLLPLIVNGYDARTSFRYHLAKLELSLAKVEKCTYIGNPRLKFSEYDLLVIYRHPELFINDSFFQKTYKYGPEFMQGAGCGYLQPEYENSFRQILINYYKRSTNCFVTLNDVCNKTSLLSSIVASGAKPNSAALAQLQYDLHNSSPLDTKKPEMIAQMNTYITASQHLSKEGRVKFVALHALGDLTCRFGIVSLNKYFLADFNNFDSAYTLQFNEPSLKLFVEDLKKL